MDNENLIICWENLDGNKTDLRNLTKHVSVTTLGAVIRKVVDSNYVGFITDKTEYHDHIFKPIENFFKKYYEVCTFILDNDITFLYDKSNDNILLVEHENNHIINIWVKNQKELLILETEY